MLKAFNFTTKIKRDVLIGNGVQIRQWAWHPPLLDEIQYLKIYPTKCERNRITPTLLFLFCNFQFHMMLSLHSIYHIYINQTPMILSKYQYTRINQRIMKLSE